MSALSRMLACLLMAGLLVVGWQGRLAAQTAAEGTSADQSPRYLPHDPSPARPLEAAGASTPDGSTETNSSTQPRGGQFNPRPHSGERLTSAGDDSAAPRPIAPPAAAAPAALPLAPPSETRGTRRSSEMSPLATGVASLAIVVGLFLVIVWAVRRGAPRGAGLLPRDVLEILGRAPLAGKQQVHLVRCGNKLLLVCVCGLTVQTLTEITDPAEVERLSELCESHGLQAATPFAHVLRQFSSSSRSGSLYAGGPGEPPEFGALDTDLSQVRGSLA